jgi:acetyltransferase-like isoleucine patch superfamily enzyme
VRKIPFGHILIAMALVLLFPLSMAYLSVSLFSSLDILGQGLTFIKAICFLVSTYIFSMISYRSFLFFFPLESGYIAKNSKQEFTFNVYILYYLLLFYPIIRSNILPVPMIRLAYQVLGAKLGDNVWPTNTLYDPIFISIGANTIVGNDTALIPHVMEGDKLGHFPILVGKNVTIGRGATVLAGVTIGDDALVAAGAVVPKGTIIGPGEIWGGMPAKLIRKKMPEEQAMPEEEGS